MFSLCASEVNVCLSLTLCEIIVCQVCVCEVNVKCLYAKFASVCEDPLYVS